MSGLVAPLAAAAATAGVNCFGSWWWYWRFLYLYGSVMACFDDALANNLCTNDEAFEAMGPTVCNGVFPKSLQSMLHYNFVNPFFWGCWHTSLVQIHACLLSNKNGSVQMCSVIFTLVAISSFSCTTAAAGYSWNIITQ
jgi:hypothetical protein